MKCALRKWRPSDAQDLAAALNNKRILENLRDGLPYPYTERDAAAYIASMQSADENDTFAYAITIEDRASAASAPSGKVIFIGKLRSWATICRKNTGAAAS